MKFFLTILKLEQLAIESGTLNPGHNLVYLKCVLIATILSKYFNKFKSLANF